LRRSTVESLSRPTPPESFGDQVRAWIEWFGLGRLVVSALAVVLVCAGAFWLVRTPPPPTEASLPRAVTSTVPTPLASSTTVASVGVAADALTVHVAGAVGRPGVYQLSPNARVHDAIEAAGGVSGDADPNALNLAAAVVDGSRVYVPVVGEEVPVVAGGSAPPVDAAPLFVDINRAVEGELEKLPGIGPATAAAIIVERDRNGPFLDVDELQRVPGIGPAKMDLVRDLVTT
jgi:competence protein ComEA